MEKVLKLCDYFFQGNDFETWVIHDSPRKIVEHYILTVTRH